MRIIHRIPFRCGRLSVCIFGLLSVARLTSSQPLIRNEPTPEPPSIQTVPARCSMTQAERLQRQQHVRNILYAWATNTDGTGALDRVLQQVVDDAAGFPVTDGTIERLARTSPSGSFIVPGLGCQERAEQAVLEQILARDLDVVPVLFAFYLRLYERQVSPPPDRLWLASRTRDRMTWLLTRYRQEAGRGASRQWRGRMLLMLADAMQLAPYHAEIFNARYVADEVVELLPDSVPARYMAATLAERSGDYRSAARRFEQLAERVPDDTEVTLRSAINRSRTGQGRRAVDSLRDLARGEAPDWIRVLAYQQWARAGDSPESVESILQEATTAFPDEPQLTLQLAAASIDRGRWFEAERLVAELGADDSEVDEGSPRRRYDRPRRDDLEEEAERFDGFVRAGLDSLRRILLEL